MEYSPVNSEEDFLDLPLDTAPTAVIPSTGKKLSNPITNANQMILRPAPIIRQNRIGHAEGIKFLDVAEFVQAFSDWKNYNKLNEQNKNLLKFSPLNMNRPNKFVQLIDNVSLNCVHMLLKRIIYLIISL